VVKAPVITNIWDVTSRSTTDISGEKYRPNYRADGGGMFRGNDGQFLSA